MDHQELTSKTFQTFSGKPPAQVSWELYSLIALLQSLGVKRYLEVGSRDGDSFFEIVRHLGEGASGVAVDLPGALWGRNDTRENLELACQELVRLGFKASCLFGNSQTEATKRLVVGRGPYDAIMLDGDHTFAGISHDFRLYGDMAPVIIFHDIAGRGCKERFTKDPVEVPQFWELLKVRDPDCEFHEFIAPGSRMGIGVMVRPIIL